MWLATVLALVAGFVLGILLMALLTISSRGDRLSLEGYQEEERRDPVPRLPEGLEQTIDEGLASELLPGVRMPTFVRLDLDLSDVWFMDRDGVEVLRSLRCLDVVVLNCSPFVAEQLKAQER